MLWRNLVAKYGLIFVIIFLFVYTLISSSLFIFQKNQLIDQAKEELNDTANQIHYYLVKNPGEANQIDELHRFLLSEIDLLVITNQNQLVNQDEISQFLIELEHMDDLSMGQIELDGEEQLIAVVQSDNLSLVLSYPIRSITAELSWFSPVLILIGLSMMMMFVIFAYFLSRRISGPLNQMRNSTEEIIDGKYDIKLPIRSLDEIGELAMSFNRMSRQLGIQLTNLLQEKEILTNIIGSMKDGVMTMNLDGDVILSNQEAENFLADLHYENEGPSQGPFPTKFDRFFQSVIEKGTSQSFQINLQGREWDIVFSPLHKNSKIRGAVALVRDVTEQHQLDQLRETFIANVSHELRTPIALMRGYSEAIIDQVTTTVEEQRELAEVIHDESERMGRLVNDLLDLTKLKSGYLDLNIEKHSIKPFLKKIQRKFSNSLQDKQLGFDVQIDNELTEISFDYDRIEQVFTNLIDNAIKHTMEKGTISLEVSLTDNQINFVLTDSGTGIPKEDLPFVFERFYMADKSRTNTDNATKGTGLGLPIVKEIIEAHQGTINVQSKIDIGTVFNFSLPLEKGALNKSTSYGTI